jgi:hypothetical protein
MGPMRVPNFQRQIRVKDTRFGDEYLPAWQAQGFRLWRTRSSSDFGIEVP